MRAVAHHLAALLTILLAATVDGAVARAADAGASPTPHLADERVLLRTNRGDIVIAFYDQIAPKHTAQILRLVRLGVYDSTWVHRVEPNFVIQITNAQGRRLPLTPEQQAAIEKIPGEFSSVPHRAGVVSMARDADPNSAETSFSFLLADAPHLDGQYTVFGQVEYGHDLLNLLASEPRDEKNTPRSPVVIESALVKTREEIQTLRRSDGLQRPIPLPAPAAEPQPPSAASAPAPSSTHTTVIVLMMMVSSLAAFLLSGRVQPHRTAALNLLTVLIGAFLVIGETVEIGRSKPLIALLLFVGIVALLKLMNRFETPIGRGKPEGPPRGTAGAASSGDVGGRTT